MGIVIFHLEGKKMGSRFMLGKLKSLIQVGRRQEGRKEGRKEWGFTSLSSA